MSAPQHELELLYRRYAPVAFRRARRMLGDPAEAHEIVHDVFLSLLQQPNHGGRSRLHTFLYSAVTHACLNRIRSRRTRERLAPHLALSRASKQPLNAEQRVMLESALRGLPAPLAQVAVYYSMDEFTQGEIAQILGCSRRQVGKLLERFRGPARNRSGAGAPFSPEPNMAES